MAEVIELLSSSSPSTTPFKSVIDLLDFEFSGLEDTLSTDFPTERPLKRRRRVSSPHTQHPAPSLLQERRRHDLLSANRLPACESPPLTTRGSSKFAAPKTTIHHLDDITFSSSAPELRDLVTSSAWVQTPEPESGEQEYSNKTAFLLANLTQESNPPTKARSRSTKPKAAEAEIQQKPVPKRFDGIEFSSSPPSARPTTAPKSSIPKQSADLASKAAAKADRDAAKEAEKERKRLERERKALEKQRAADLAEVNKSKTHKKNAAPEMIVDLSSVLRGTSVGTQVEEYMQNIEVEVRYVDEEVDMTHETMPEPDLYGSIVSWRRKVASTYNDEDGQWEPASRTRIVKERHILVYLPAVEFAAVVGARRSQRGPTEAEMKESLDGHVASIRRQFGSCVPIYLIEGLQSWLRKNVNAKNRAYTAAVRAQMVDAPGEPSSQPGQGGSHSRSRKRKKPPADTLDLSYITSDVVDDLLLHLQLAHQPLLIHHTTTPSATAAQISTLTQHLSTRPYRLAQLDYNLKSAAFCMDGGQVRTGDDARDTFVKMLQEVQRVTPSMAYGIVNQWDTVRKLVTGFDRQGNLMLEDVRKTVNKDGAWSDRRLGPMISRRLHKVFMGRDPSATDGMS